MATLIRIKRRFNEEPTDSIVVKSKRRRIEDEAAETPGDIFTPTILKRVATVSSKEEHLEPEVLKELQKEFKKGWQLREQYKRLSKAGAHRDAAKRETKQRIKNNREEAHASHRPTLCLNVITRIIPGDEGKGQRHKRGGEGKKHEGANKTTEVKPEVEGKGQRHKRGREEEKDEGANKTTEVKPEDEGKGQQQKRGREGEKDEGANSAAPPLSTVKDIKYYDTELSSKKVSDVITCNGVPMETEKFVYDIYYWAHDVDWTKYVCDIQKFTYESSSDDDEDKYEDDDDENDENNWRNDYPEEEEEDDSSDQDNDDEGRHLHRSHSRQFDPDESFDAEEYEEEPFDEEGNLIECDYNSETQKLKTYISALKLHSDSEED